MKKLGKDLGGSSLSAKMKTFHAFLLVLAFGTTLLFASNRAYAQTTTGTISGTVKDSTGAVIPGAAVTIRNADTGITRNVTTGEAGHFLVPQLALGNYEIIAEAPGFQVVVRSGITLTVGREARVDFTMQVGAVSERITVTGEAPVIETTTSALSGLMDERSIRELPLNERSFDHLALLEVAVARFDDTLNSGVRGRGQAISVAGSRAIQNSYLIDGMDANDYNAGPIGSILGVNMGVEAIREFQILTSTIPAEFGKSPGGVINAATRSGGNELHGSVYEYLRNAKLDAKNFFDPHDEPIPSFKRNQYGFSLGGPIKKDRLFFFGNYEALKLRKGLSYQAVVPSLKARQGILPDGPVTIAESIKPYLALYPSPKPEDELSAGGAAYYHSPVERGRQDYLMTRVDGQLSQSHSAFARYILEDAHDENPQKDGVYSIDLTSRRHLLVLGLDSVFSPTVLNSFRAGLTRSVSVDNSLPINAIDPKLAFEPGPDTSGLSGILGTINITGFEPLGTFRNSPRVYVQNLFEYSDTLHYMTGAHAFKFGADVKRPQANVSLATNERGGLSFSSMRAFLTGVPTTYSSVGRQGYPRGFRQWNLGFFAQDDYKVTSNLTLNLGVRWEFATNPSEVNGKMSNIVHLMADADPTVGVGIETTKRTIEPRIGFAWSPARLNQKTSIRGGFGIYHDHMAPVLYANYVGSLGPWHERLTVRNPGFPDFYAGGKIVPDAPTYKGVQVRDNVPDKMSFNLNVQHEILTNTSVLVGYVGSQSRHNAVARELNGRTPTLCPAAPCPSSLAAGTTFFASNAPFLNPALGSMNLLARAASASFNAFVVSLRRIPRGPLGFQISYTWSKNIDNASGAGTDHELTSSATQAMDVDNINRDRGLSSFDVRHNFSGSYTLALPSTGFQGIFGALLNVWETQGILTLASGTPFGIETGFSRSRSARSSTGGTDRPDLAPGRSNNPVLGGPDRYFDPTAFVLPPVGTFGNLARNSVIGAGRFNFDSSLGKTFSFSERTNL